MFSDFKQISKQEWLEKVIKDLKGKPLEGLNWDLAGQTYSPFFHADDIPQFPPLINEANDNSWGIGEKIIVSDFVVANKLALSALEKGANTLCFEFTTSPNKQQLGLLSKGIHFTWIATQFVNVKANFIDSFHALLLSKNEIPAAVDCAFLLQEFNTKDLKNSQINFPKGKFLTVNALPEYQGNEHTSQELAFCIAHGNKLLTQLADADLSIKDYYQNIQFYLTLGGNYFLDIAKIRALKTLWNQVLIAWDNTINDYPNIQIFLTTQHQTKDEHYNKIMTSTQAMSAVIGGVHQLFIEPSDAFNEKDGTTFSRRIALNVQHLLQQESYLDRVKDPAAGSYFIETLTNDLAEQAWKIFQTQELL